MRNLINLQKEGKVEKLASEYAKRLERLAKLPDESLQYYQELYKEAFSSEERSD